MPTTSPRDPFPFALGMLADGEPALFAVRDGQLGMTVVGAGGDLKTTPLGAPGELYLPDVFSIQAQWQDNYGIGFLRGTPRELERCVLIHAWNDGLWLIKDLTDAILALTAGEIRDALSGKDKAKQGKVIAVHTETQRVVVEHFAEERDHLKALPAGPFNTVLALERRITRDGMVSVAGNLYSVPDSTRRRTVEVQITAGAVNILEDGILIASHPAQEGRGQRRIAPGHRTQPPPANSRTAREEARPEPRGSTVTPRSLAIYDAIGRRLASQQGVP